MNHPNHARWFVKMLDKYLKIDKTHAEISKEFTKDRFGVKKNEEKSCVLISIELTLEKQQMPMRPVNKQAHYLLRTRWAISHFIRVSVVSRLLKSLDFNIQEDTPSDLKTSKIKNKANAILKNESVFT